MSYHLVKLSCYVFVQKLILLLMLLICAQDTSCSLFITFQTHIYKFSLHKTSVKTNLHEVSLWEYNNFFARYDILPGQRVCMKCLKRAKDDDNDNTLKDNVDEVDMENDEVPVETAWDIVDKSFQLFDCSPLKSVKSDRTLPAGKRKINSVTSTLTKAVAIALDEPTLDTNMDCSNCARLVELIKEKLSTTKERSEIVRLLTIVPNDFTISKVVEVFNVSEYSAKRARELRFKKGILSIPEKKERVGISQTIKDAVSAFYESEQISRLLPGKKDCVSVRLPDKTKTKVQKRLLLSSISEMYTLFKKENPDKKIGLSLFALLGPKWCIHCRCSRHTQCLFVHTIRMSNLCW